MYKNWDRSYDPSHHILGRTWRSVPLAVGRRTTAIWQLNFAVPVRSLKRMKSFTILLLLGLVGCTREPRVDYSNIVTILTYSTLGSKDGFLARVRDDFKNKSGCSLQIELTLGAAQVLAYLEEPKQRERIDVVMGLDEILFGRSKQYYHPVNAVSAKYLPLLKARATNGFYPTDYAALSMIYIKSEFGPGKAPVPKKLSDLLDPKLKKKFIVQDPRVSSPGLWFFLFADQIVKTDALAKQWLAVAPSWDASYKMFLAGEAPMVWSYVTSLAYHASQKQLDQYGYVDFQEGLPVQVEGMGVVNRSGDPFKAKPCVQKWVEYVLTPETQTKLAEAQWMLPALAGAPIPSFLSMVPATKKAAVMNQSIDRVDEIVTHFGRAAAN